MHFQQSQAWKKVKERVGNKTYEVQNIWFQTTKAPLLGYEIGYVPPVKFSEISLEDIKQKASELDLAYVTVDFEDTSESFGADKKRMLELLGVENSKSVRLQRNVLVDLTKSEDALLSDIHRKVKYNIRYGAKKGVRTEFKSTQDSFETFLKLFKETKARQRFFGRNEYYLRAVWHTFREEGIEIIIATSWFNDEPLVSWFLIGFEGTLYYPYGGTSDKQMKLKSTYTHAWELFKYAKKKGYRTFDWMGIEEPNTEGKYEGFSAYKVQFGGDIITYADSVDIVIDPKRYRLLKVARKLRDSFSILKNIS